MYELFVIDLIYIVLNAVSAICQLSNGGIKLGKMFSRPVDKTNSTNDSFYNITERMFFKINKKVYILYITTFILSTISWFKRSKIENELPKSNYP